MKVDGRYYCFGCHETGGVIDLTAKLFALTPLNAARKLAADFHLDPEAPVPALPPAVQAQIDAMAISRFGFMAILQAVSCRMPEGTPRLTRA